MRMESLKCSTKCSLEAKIKSRMDVWLWKGGLTPSTGDKHICILLQPFVPKTEIFFIKF